MQIAEFHLSTGSKIVRLGPLQLEKPADLGTDVVPSSTNFNLMLRGFMLAGRHKDLSERIGRNHPWTHAEYDAGLRYYDFVKEPNLISSVLEDFRPLAHTPAVQRFYEFLRWINGPESCMESTDCGLRPLQENCDVQFAKARRILGRVMVIFRREDINTYEQNSNWLLDCFEFHLQRVDPEFTSGAVELARFPTKFVRIDKMGYQLQLQFFSYGDDDNEVLDHLDQTLRILREAAENVNRQIREWKLCP